MAHDILAGNWKQLKGRVKEEWGELTDDDLNRIQGNRMRLEGTLQEKYGRTKAEVSQEVDDFLNDLGDEDYDDEDYDV